jgi:DNA repair exonuclease SbcCD nuclease subunit
LSDGKFSFIHAADLHLGSPFSGLALKDEQVARQFAAAGREAFSDLVTQAIDSDAAFMVIAGDVYDGDWKDNTIGLFFNRELARLERAGIRVILLKGNHDAESVISRTIPLPASVQQFSSRAPETFRLEDLKVALHGRSFPNRAVTENFAADYPPPVPGWFNIGVLHTSCTGRPGHETYAPCTPAELAARGYQYWALGHVHEHEVLSQDPWIVFPGNLQGRNARECGAKGAVGVTVVDGQVTTVERLLVDKARWAIVAVDVAGTETRSEVLEAVHSAIAPLAAGSEARPMAVRVRLSGPTRLHRHLLGDQPQLRDEVQAVAHQAARDIWIESVRLETCELEARAPRWESAGFDLGAALAAAAASPETGEQVEKLLAGIRAKLPAGLADDETTGLPDRDALLAEARALVLGHLSKDEG